MKGVAELLLAAYNVFCRISIKKKLTEVVLEGLSRDKAKSKLQSVGLHIGNTETEETDDKSMDGKVIGQTPSSGKTVEEGTYVDIVIGEYREPDTSSGDVSSDN